MDQPHHEVSDMRIIKKIGNVLRNGLGGGNYYRTPWATPKPLAELARTVKPYTLCDSLRIATLHGLAGEIRDEKIPGDIVECGVFNGGTGAVLAEAISGDAGRKIWLYDTFEGMPVPGDKDGPLAASYTGQVRGSMDMVKEVLGKVGFPENRAVLRKGLFADTFQQPLPEQVALLHVDSDWYDSVLLTLRTFYPRVPEGGVIVLDDFGHWEGAREAFYDFCAEASIRPLLERTGNTQAHWRKGKTHTRDSFAHYRLGPYRPGCDVAK
jgi:O-methyltransferase